MMSSRAWDDVPTGAAARSFGRWLRLVAPGVFIERLILLAGMVGVIFAFGAIYWYVQEVPYGNDCFNWCNSLPPRLDVVF
jgi:hypothetical protein